MFLGRKLGSINTAMIIINSPMLKRRESKVFSKKLVSNPTIVFFMIELLPVSCCWVIPDDFFLLSVPDVAA